MSTHAVVSGSKVDDTPALMGERTHEVLLGRELWKAEIERQPMFLRCS